MLKKIRNKIKNKNKPVIGFIIYFIIIILFIPNIILYFNNYDLLAMYLPNVDLIATLFSYKSFVLSNNYFDELYVSNPKTTFGIISTEFINYIALLGLTFLVAQHTFDTNSISHGWSIAFVMILFTYLLPGVIIPKIMDFTYDNINKILPNKYINKYNETNIKYITSIFIGIILTILIILFESNFLKRYAKILVEISQKIIYLGNNI